MEQKEIVRTAWNLIKYGNNDELQRFFNANSKTINANSFVTDPEIEQQTFLMIASSSNSKKCMEFLISQGADIDTRNYNGYTALHFAAYSGAIDSLTYLLSLIDEKASSIDSHLLKNITVDCRTIDGKTPLYLAASRGNLHAVEVLVHNGADVNACDSEGYTPLIAALIGNHKNVVEYLIKSGADVFHLTADKLTPSVIASDYKRKWFKTN